MIQTSHLRLDNVTKKFGRVVAVDRITLEIPRGTFATLLGPSGCGKTTLLRMIAGFYEADEGGIYVDDKRVDRMPPHKRGTAMVFQDYALWPHMTVFDNIAYGLRMQKVARDEITRRVNETMHLVEMPATLLERRPSELSGGQQQRVAVARALITQPKVLLLDEPLSNLDAKVRQRLRVEIRRLQKRIGITSVYVTHDQEEALSMSDMVVVMKDGRVQQIGKPEDVYHHPANVFVADFLGISNLLRGTVTAGGKQVLVAGAHIAHEGTPGNSVTVVFKADEAQIGQDVRQTDEMVLFDGTIEESSFIGTVYRYYVNVNGEVILVDMPEKISDTKVKVAVPKDKIQVYES